MTASKTHDFRINRKFQILEPILKKWQKLNNDVLSCDEDVAWWYNERASLSVFAGAVWKCGGWAFEEFSIERGNQSARKKAHGRCDIQFEFKNRKYIGEAKQTWLTLGKKGSKGIQKKVEKDLCSARSQIQQIHEPGNQRIAMTFVVPGINGSEEDNVNKHIDDLVQELQKIKNATLAWTFPKFARKMSPENKFRNYIFPGVALVLMAAD